MAKSKKSKSEPTLGKLEKRAKKWKARAKSLAEELMALTAPLTKKVIVSPLAPKDGFPKLPQIAGVDFAAGQAGVRYKGRTDVMLALLAEGSVVAGTFTRSATRS